MEAKGKLRLAIEKFLLEFGFGGIIAKALGFVREKDETEWLEFLDAILDLVLNSTKQSPELQKLLNDMKLQKHQLGSTLLAGMGSTAVGGATSSVLAPVFRIINAQIETQLHSNIPDLGMAMELNNRGYLKAGAVFDILNLLGYHPTLWPAIVDASKPHLGVSEFINLSRRFPEARQFYIDKILGLGWQEKDLNQLLAISLQYPSAQDWIQFAVREATNEQQVKELGLDANYPSEAETEAEKSGLAPGMFRFYWRAHWQLPSVSHAMEFLHRLRPGRTNVSFDAKDFASLMVALDISPKWHDHYKAISYNPIGRVDLRRIYKTTNKDRQWLVEAYRDVSYSPEDAETMADWTIVDAEASMRDASLSTIEKSVERGIIDETEAQEMLEALRYGDKDITLYLTMWRYNAEEKRISAEIDYLKVRYLNAELNEAELRSELNQLKLSPNNIEIALTNLNAQRARQVKPLSVAEVQQMYESNIIDYKTVLEELVARGTTKINAERLSKLVDLKVQKARQKELNEEQKELERVQLSELSKTKAIELAIIQVKIAELNAEVADLKVIYPEITDLDTIQAIEARLSQIKQLIAYLNLEKTKVNLAYAEEF